MIAWPNTANAVTGLHDSSAALMPHDGRKDSLRILPGESVSIRVADPGSFDLKQYFTVLWPFYFHFLNG
jgi:hypothetical protein